MDPSRAMAAPKIMSQDYYPYGSSYDQYNPYGKGRNAYFSPYLRNPVPLEQEMTFDKFAEIDQWTKKKNIVTLEKALKELPENMTNDNYVLMYLSRSLQKATPMEPRVIMLYSDSEYGRVVQWPGQYSGDYSI